MSDKRKDPNRCPLCNNFLISNGVLIKCLGVGCKFETDAKRKTDKDLPGLKETKDIWH
uniref:Uncharacterized protein n=1 Tax=viral metagenome TaxID=1070528 RepID=A0A6M3JDG4_9ZZZZ